MQENDVPMEEIPKSDEEFPNLTIPNLTIQAMNLTECNNCLYGPSTSSTYPIGHNIPDIPVSYCQTCVPNIQQSIPSSLTFASNATAALTTQLTLLGAFLDKQVHNALLTSPHSLVASGILAPEALSNQALWDQWMCLLATTLTPIQWQTYWQNYAVIFGAPTLPAHLVNFLNNVAQAQNEPMVDNDPIGMEKRKQAEEISGFMIV